MCADFDSTSGTAQRDGTNVFDRLSALRAGTPHFSPAAQGQFGASRPSGSSIHNVSNPIQLISLGAPAAHHSVEEISSYLVSVAAGREVVGLLHLGKCSEDLWCAAQDLGWEPRECIPCHESMQASYLSACLGVVFSLVESSSHFPGNSSMSAKVVVACFELSNPDLLLLRLIGKVHSPFLEICAQMRM